MPAHIERFATRLLLVVAAAAAASLAGRYHGDTQASLWLLAAVAFAGVAVPISTRHPDEAESEESRGW